MRYSLILLSILFVTPGYSLPYEQDKATKKPVQGKTTTMDIATDLPPPASAEKVVPTHPFFSESGANELMERIQELEARVQRLEKAVEVMQKRL